VGKKIIHKFKLLCTQHYLRLYFANFKHNPIDQKKKNALHIKISAQKAPWQSAVHYIKMFHFLIHFNQTSSNTNVTENK
jgi:hypothetical protein